MPNIKITIAKIVKLMILITELEPESKCKQTLENNVNNNL